jgi:hypothetical protein
MGTTNTIEGIDDETRKPNGKALSVHVDRGDVLRIHIEAADGLPQYGATIHVWRHDLLRLAEVAAAVAAERERCATLIDALLVIDEAQTAQRALAFRAALADLRGGREEPSETARYVEAFVGLSRCVPVAQSDAAADPHK